jgi:septum site-determining protein MinC
MAGAHGDETARVFCTRLEAELLAIAGLYRTSESLAPEYGLQNVQAFLKNERLCVETLG